MKKILFGLLLFLSFAQISSAVEFAPDFALRLRHTLLDMKETDSFNTSYFRLRTSAGLNTKFNDTFSVYAKLLNENKYYLYNVKNKNDDYVINEFIFDNLYIDIRNLLNGLLNIRIGRQNLLEYGEKFLLCEGTPSDGSRTVYFNAAKFQFDAKAFSVDIIALSGTEYDQYLPVFNQNDPATRLNGCYEQAIMAFVKSDLSKHVYMEPYYIYKSEEDDSYRQINTFGAYLRYTHESFAVRTQFAAQVKEKNSRSANAFGGYTFIEKPGLILKDKFTIGYVYLSGNKAGTDADESWNSLFNRGVHFFETDLLGTLFIPECGEFGYWSNMQMYNIEYRLKISEKFSVSSSFNLLYANENVSGEIFGTGKDRGNLTLLGLYYKINQNMQALIYGEYFKAGNFYDTDKLNCATFVKTEISMKF